jgi:hypothetical protein
MTEHRVPTGGAASVVILLSSVACSVNPSSSVTDEPPALAHPNPVSTSTTTPSRVAGVAIEHGKLPIAVAKQARSFAERFIEYDASRDVASSFITRVRPLCTRSLVRRLHMSERARLEWAPLRARAEQTSLTITGIQANRPISEGLHAHSVVLTGIVTTTSSMGTVRSLIRLRFVVMPNGSGLRISHVAGGGA